MICVASVSRSNLEAVRTELVPDPPEEASEGIIKVIGAVMGIGALSK